MPAPSYQEAMKKARAIREPNRLRAWQFLPENTPVKWKLWMYVFSSTDGCYEPLPKVAATIQASYKDVWSCVQAFLKSGDMAYEPVKDKFGNERKALFCRVPEGLLSGAKDAPPVEITAKHPTSRTPGKPKQDAKAPVEANTYEAYLRMHVQPVLAAGLSTPAEKKSEYPSILSLVPPADGAQWIVDAMLKNDHCVQFFLLDRKETWEEYSIEFATACVDKITCRGTEDHTTLHRFFSAAAKKLYVPPL